MKTETEVGNDHYFQMGGFLTYIAKLDFPWVRKCNKKVFINKQLHKEMLFCLENLLINEYIYFTERYDKGSACHSFIRNNK